jgi:transposase
MEWWFGRRSFWEWRRVHLSQKWDERLDAVVESSGSGRSDSAENEWPGFRMSRAGGVPRFFPSAVIAHLVKLACDLPDDQQRSLSLWTCAELARTLERDKIASISAQSVQRILASYRLKPWRVHYWLNAKGPRDEEFRRRTKEICELYTRELEPHERVLCVDEKTSLQPRTRKFATRAARPDIPVRVEHEYRRSGALQLFAAFDTRSGEVLGVCRPRKRQEDFIELLAEIERQTPPSITLIRIVCDNLPMHSGKKVLAWLESHPRFRFHFTPVHCSWMNQIEQWFSILQRKRLSAPNFQNLKDLESKLRSFIAEWNEHAHPFRWSKASFTKVLAAAEDSLPCAA